MTRTAVRGLPRIGPNRELKFALGRYWRGEINESYLSSTGADLRAANWRRASGAGVDVIPLREPGRGEVGRRWGDGVDGCAEPAGCTR